MAVAADNLPADVRPGDLRGVYPTLKSVIGLNLIARDRQRITDDEIEDVLTGHHWRRDFDGELIPLLLHVLFDFRDERAVPVAMRIARNIDFRPDWELAFQLLATRRSPEVDDFFVEFLIRPDEPDRPELTRIVDDYFRQHSAHQG